MENASKALIMAATVLMGLLLISLAVYLFATFGNVLTSIATENEATILAQFNAQFSVYDGNDRTFTIQDVVTIASLAKQNNDDYNMATGETITENTMYVEVKLRKSKTGNSYIPIHEYSIENNNNLIEESDNQITVTSGNINIPQYQIEKISYSTETGRIYSIQIKRIS